MAYFLFILPCQLKPICVKDSARYSNSRPPLLPFNLLVEILIVSPALPLRTLLSVGAGFGLLIGAMEWWGMDDPRQGFSFVVLSGSCLALLAGLWGGIAAAVGVLAFALALIIGGAVMFLNNGYNDSGRGWVATSIGGAVTLMGLPLTVGFIGASALYRGLVEQGGMVFVDRLRDRSSYCWRLPIFD